MPSSSNSYVSNYSSFNSSRSSSASPTKRSPPPISEKKATPIQEVKSPSSVKDEEVIDEDANDLKPKHTPSSPPLTPKGGEPQEGGPASSRPVSSSSYTPASTSKNAVISSTVSVPKNEAVNDDADEVPKSPLSRRPSSSRPSSWKDSSKASSRASTPKGGIYNVVPSPKDVKQDAPPTVGSEAAAQTAESQTKSTKNKSPRDSRSPSASSWKDSSKPSSRAPSSRASTPGGGGNDKGKGEDKGKAGAAGSPRSIAASGPSVSSQSKVAATTSSSPRGGPCSSRASSAEGSRQPTSSKRAPSSNNRGSAAQNATGRTASSTRASSNAGGRVGVPPKPKSGGATRTSSKPPNVLATQAPPPPKLSSEALSSAPPSSSGVGGNKRQSRVEATISAMPSEQAPLTAEEREQWRALDADNKKLIHKLSELNMTLDKQLAKQGITLPSRPGGAAAAAGLGPLSPASDLSRLKHRAEALRKSNGELQKALKEHGAVRGSSVDMKNQLGQLLKELQGLKSDNQSLENVHNNQLSKTSQDDKAQGELRRMRSDHNEAQREVRDTTRQLKELRETETTNLRNIIKQQELLNEKLRFLAEEKASRNACGAASLGVGAASSGAGGTPPSSTTKSSGKAEKEGRLSGKFAVPSSFKERYDVAALQRALQSLADEEAELLKDISALTTKTSKARWRLAVDKKTAELEDLREELKLLKEHADAKRITY